ncbi:unnamed protein product, partial [Mycena citricolor]
MLFLKNTWRSLSPWINTKIAASRSSDSKTAWHSEMAQYASDHDLPGSRRFCAACSAVGSTRRYQAGPSRKGRNPHAQADIRIFKREARPRSRSRARNHSVPRSLARGHAEVGRRDHATVSERRWTGLRSNRRSARGSHSSIAITSCIENIVVNHIPILTYDDVREFPETRQTLRNAGALRHAIFDFDVALVFPDRSSARLPWMEFYLGARKSTHDVRQGEYD